MMSGWRSLAVPLVFALLLVGCPRQVGTGDGGTVGDSGYDPSLGYPYEGSFTLDDERTRGIEPSALRAGSSPCRAPVLGRVYRITDGDTIWVRGESEVLDAHVRLIGIDTPEIARPPVPAQCYGDEATAFTTQLEGRLVWLTFDNDCFDDFDRLLAYVHVGGGDRDMWERQLLRRGLATVLTVGANRSYATLFGGDENTASMSNVGLWSACF